VGGFRYYGNLLRFPPVGLSSPRMGDEGPPARYSLRRREGFSPAPAKIPAWVSGALSSRDRHEIRTGDREGGPGGHHLLPSRHFQLYVQQKGASTPSAAEISPSEARRLGSLLSGAIIEAEKEAVEIAFSALADLRIGPHLPDPAEPGREVHCRPAGAHPDRRHHRGGLPAGPEHGIPAPDFTFEDGDIAVVIGETEQLQEFEHQVLES